MHQELQEVSTSRTSRTGALRSSRPSRGAPLWAWLLLGALAVPGARSFLSEEQEELLVELHNHYRGLVAPSASAMLPLRWDPALKVVSEGYAAKCIWNHNPELEDTGENLFAGTGSLDLREALEKWFLERMHYDFQNNSCDEDKMCGHYTQMVWADTHRVGCAFHLCNNMEGLDWERVSFLVCNYYPAGNYEDERPYVEGDWCSRCPENLQLCENNLCVADTVDEEEEEEEEEEEGTVTPPALVDPSPQPADTEVDEVVLPSATADPVQPETSTAPIISSSSSSSSSSEEESEDTQPAATPPPGTEPPPEVSSPVTDKEEKVEKEEEKGVGSSDSMKDAAGAKYQTEKILINAGSAGSPPLLLACVAAILTLRL